MGLVLDPGSSSLIGAAEAPRRWDRAGAGRRDRAPLALLLTWPAGLFATDQPQVVITATALLASEGERHTCTGVSVMENGPEP